MHTFSIRYTHTFHTNTLGASVDKGKGAKEHKILCKKCDAKRLHQRIHKTIRIFLNREIPKPDNSENALQKNLHTIYKTYNIQDLKLIYLRKKSFFTKFFAQSTEKKKKIHGKN